MVSFLGYSHSEIAALLLSVGIDVESELELRDTFARCVWNTIVEPGDSGLSALLAHCGSADDALSLFLAQELPAQFHEANQRWHPRFDATAVESALRAASEVGAMLLTPQSANWPRSVTDLGAHQPALLWCRGDSALLSRLDTSVSVVGARASTGYGEHVTYDIVSGLVDRGFTIVSGGAYGIDGVAHRTALASGGETIALMAGGIDRFYPSGHETLLRNIEQTGLVVAELPCGTAPTRWRFLQRNRLIAAFTPVTVVVEAGWRSGSLNTAHHAATLGRILTAVPGPVTSPSSAGCHRLMREAEAICVTSASDITQLVGSDGAEEFRFTASEQRVLDALHQRRGISIDDLAEETGVQLRELHVVLAELDVKSVVTTSGGLWFSRK